MMDMVDAIRKVKACLARANDEGAGPDEAATALRQAKALIAKFDLDPNLVAMSDIEEVEISVGQSVRQWRKTLAACIGKAFSTYPLITKYTTNTRKRASAVKFIGPKHRVAISAWAFEACTKAVERAKEREIITIEADHATKMRLATTFCDAFVEGLREQVNQFSREATAYTPGNDEALKAYLDEKYGDGLRKSKVRQRDLSDDELAAWISGVTKGAKHSLHVPVDGHQDDPTLPQGGPLLLGRGDNG